jgi:HTH-type transcriptional regulator / antitoxin HigA
MGTGATPAACRDRQAVNMDARTFQADWFSKPADSLLAAMRRRGVTAEAVANRLAGGIHDLRALVSGTLPIDEPIANSISKAVGGSAEFWLRRQANYERDLERATSAVPADEADVWLTTIPAPSPQPRGRMTEETRRSELQRRLAYFGVGTLGAWRRRYSDDRRQTRFRDSKTYASRHGAVSMWLRQGELEAALVDTAKWDADALKARLLNIRKLSHIRRPDRFLPKLKELLAESGVALVVVRAPDGCKASGASRLISPDKAMILLSFRYRSDDQFWFTVFHEIGHLLLHGARSFIDEDETVEDKCEREANSFAVEQIVPANRVADFERVAPTRDSIMRYSVSVGVSSGLVLGQLQRRGRVPRDKMNYLRKRWTWAEIEAAISNL